MNKSKSKSNIKKPKNKRNKKIIINGKGFSKNEIIHYITRTFNFTKDAIKELNAFVKEYHIISIAMQLYALKNNITEENDPSYFRIKRLLESYGY